MLCAGDTRSGGNQNVHDACQVNSMDVPRAGGVRAMVEGVTLGFKSGASKKKTTEKGQSSLNLKHLNGSTFSGFVAGNST